MESKKIVEIFDYFREMFGSNPKCELNYSSDVQLLVAVILSAQCTDKRVNLVTKELFKKYKSVQDFANANQTELEKDIYSTGFYHNKAKNIIAMAKHICTFQPQEIPKTMEELTALPGVGRKTASVFMSEFYNIPAIAVDTHVMRISRRLGLTNGKVPARSATQSKNQNLDNPNPEQIEQDLKKLFNESNWGKYHHYMVLFGRYHCTAKNPKCSDCKIRHFCDFLKTQKQQS